MWNFKYSIFDIQHLIFDIQYLISNIISNIRNGKGGNLVDLITVNEMCYKSANVANVADLANVLQIGIGRIVIEILIVIVIVIVINFYDAMYHEIEIIFI